MSDTDQRTNDALPLIDLLLRSLKELAAAERTETACQLAGQACAALRHDDPKGWQKLNALLHRLTKMAGC